jgi:transcriptional antiterminator RfaH
MFSTTMHVGCCASVLGGMRVAYRSERTSWIVVRTKPSREALAITNLERQGFTVYCPYLKKRIRHGRKSFDATRPLFPGYVFVAADSETMQWRPMLSTLGVSTVVCAGDRPALLAGDVIEALKAREVGGLIGVRTGELQPGQKVAVQGGPFDGVIGTILDARENERHLILLELLNTSVKARVEQVNLRLAS